MIWLITVIFFMALQSGLVWLREGLSMPWLVPDFDLLFVLLVGMFARRGRVTVLLILMACVRSVLVGTTPAASVAVYLAVGWALVATRHLLFRKRLPGLLAFAFFGLGLLRFLLAGLAYLGRGVPWPPWTLWLAPAAITALLAVMILPLLCYLPPMSFHLERSRE